MAVGITLSKTRFRYDSPLKPKITVTGLVNGLGRVKIGEQLFVPISNSSDYTFNPKNRTEIQDIAVYDFVRPTWTRGTNVNLDGSNDLVKVTANSAVGGYVVLSNTNTQVEANVLISGQIPSTDKRVALSLQDGTVKHGATDYGKHALVFQEDGYCAVYEDGIRKDYTQTEYIADTIGLIINYNNIIRYYIMLDGILLLLRTTRSKLPLNDIKGAISLYDIGATVTEGIVFESASGEPSAVSSLETIGVLDNFQGWFNDFAYIPTGNALTMQDGRKQTSYSNTKKFLRSLAVDRSVVNKIDRDAYVEFFQFHLNDKDFIFLDRAKQDWFWANFTSAFSDKTRASCLSAESVQVLESYKKDVILLEEGDPPTVPQNFLLTVVSPTELLASWDASDDGVNGSGIDYYELTIT